MPQAWSNKDERQYEHIVEAERDRGVPSRRAKEIAGRTVNKQRRIEGRTPNRTTQGTGNPRLSLDARPVQELRNLASQHRIPGRSRMNKQELIRALRRS
jgi:hypothetical protein